MPTPAVTGLAKTAPNAHDPDEQEERLRIHGSDIRGGDQVPRSSLSQGRFGRLFRRLEPTAPYTDADLQAMADTMRDQPGPGGPAGWGSPAAPDAEGDNPDIPAAYTYFGQFIDHDITFDPASDLQKVNDPDALIDFRTPRFDLDSVYGSGPADEPFQYDQDQPGRFLVAANTVNEVDLPRNSQEIAVIGDPRNDENNIVSQIQLLFLKLHNRLLTEIVETDPAITPDRRFEEAQRLVRWHYQWVVAHDYLRKVCGQPLIDELFKPNRQGIPRISLDHYRARTRPYMPVEFSVAAYRFGHSQVRAAYHLNERIRDIPIFVPGDPVAPTADLRGGKNLPHDWSIQWELFVPLGPDAPQPSRSIDAKLTPALFDLPRIPADHPQSLAFLNLKRGQAVGLPSGQDVARYLGVDRVLDARELGVPEPTPLWLYLLKEAELTEDESGNKARRLGPTGGTIVAEVLLGLLRGDPQSYYGQQPAWQPTLPHRHGEGNARKFDLTDLVAYART